MRPPVADANEHRERNAVSQAAARVSNTAPQVVPVVSHQSLGFLERHHFLFRRLHSLTGIMPVGVFVIFHLFTNAQMAVGTFDHEVGWIHSLPALLFLEVFGLWLPIAFHAALGIVYIYTGRRNTLAYPYGGNWRYALQRWTAWVSLLFIFFHIATLRWGWTFGGILETPFIFPHEEVSSQLAAAGLDASALGHASTAIALQYSPLVFIAYVIGVYAVIFHWANGLWTSAITWGLTLSVKSQRNWGYVCLVMGIVLSLFAAAALWGAMAYDVKASDRAAIAAYQAHLETGELPDVQVNEDGSYVLRSQSGVTTVTPDGQVRSEPATAPRP